MVWLLAALAHGGSWSYAPGAWCDAPLQKNFSAATRNPECVLTITQERNFQRGSAWLTEQEPWTADHCFRTSFQMQISGVDGDTTGINGGDGMVFAIQNDGPTNLG